MRNLARTETFTRRHVAVLAALALSALAAPLAAGASRALATPEAPAELRLAPVESTPVAVAVAAPGAEAPAPCLRKVRVVYGGYGTPAGACAAR